MILILRLIISTPSIHHETDIKKKKIIYKPNIVCWSFSTHNYKPAVHILHSNRKSSTSIIGQHTPTIHLFESI